MDTRIDLTKINSEIEIKDCPFCIDHKLKYTNHKYDHYYCEQCKCNVATNYNGYSLTHEDLHTLFTEGHLTLKTSKKYGSKELLIINNKCESFVNISKSRLQNIDNKTIKHSDQCTNKDNKQSLMRVYSDESEIYIWCPECHVFTVLNSKKNNLIDLDNEFIPEYFLNKKSNKFNQNLNNINSKEQEYNEADNKNLQNKEKEALDEAPKYWDFFISHSNKDDIKNIRDFIEKFTKKEYYKYWIDSKLEQNEDFTNTIVQAIPDSKFFLLLASKNSLGSDEVLKEVLQAKENNLDIYVISIDEEVTEKSYKEYLHERMKKEYPEQMTGFIWLGYFNDKDKNTQLIYRALKCITEFNHDIYVAYDQNTLEDKKYKKDIKTFCNNLKDKYQTAWCEPFDQYESLSQKLIENAKIIFVIISNSTNESPFLENNLAKIKNESKQKIYITKLDKEIKINRSFEIDRSKQDCKLNDLTNAEKLYQKLIYPIIGGYKLFFLFSSNNEYKLVKEIADKLTNINCCCELLPDETDENKLFEQKKQRWNKVLQSEKVIIVLTPSIFNATKIPKDFYSDDIIYLSENYKMKLFACCVADPNYNEAEAKKIIKQIQTEEQTQSFYYPTMNLTWIDKKGKTDEQFIQDIADYISKFDEYDDTNQNANNDNNLINKLKSINKVNLAFIITIILLLSTLAFVTYKYNEENLSVTNSPIDRIIVKNNKTTKAIDTQNFGIGSIIRFGTYWNKPIYWIYAFDDQDGNQVFISREIVTFKPFDVAHNNIYAKLSNGTAIDLHPMPDETIHKYMNRFTTSKWIDSVGDNSWEHSTLRTWLNSNAMNVPYEFHAPSIDNTNQETAGPIGTAYVEKINEPGFLAEFNDHELKLLEAKDHDLILSVYNKDSSSKGDQLFNFFDNLDPEQNLYKDTLKAKAKPFIFDFQSVYKKTLQDKVTIPSLEDFIIISQDQRIDLQYTKEIFSATGDSFVLPLTRWWLDTPCGYTPTTVCNVLGSDFNKDKPIIKIAPSSDFSGVRPMIRLPFKSYKMKGAGTLEDPYFIDFDSL